MVDSDYLRRTNRKSAILNSEVFFLCTFQNIFKLDTVCVPIPAPVEKIPKTAMKRAFLVQNKSMLKIACKLYIN